MQAGKMTLDFQQRSTCVRPCFISILSARARLPAPLSPSPLHRRDPRLLELTGTIPILHQVRNNVAADAA
jgi:hypothetical protein